jgi:hypothetical protein
MSAGAAPGRLYLSAYQERTQASGDFSFPPRLSIKLSDIQEMTMHADPAHDADGASLTQEETELLSELDVPGTRHAAHSLLSVLMPATPPEPKNARIIRLFDFDGEKPDAKPAESAAAAEQDAAPKAADPQAIAAAAPAKPEPKSRDAAKAARNQSLFAAARLL